MNNDLAEIIVLRKYVPDDHAFVMSTFLRGLYYGDSWFSLIPKEIFMASYKKAAEAIVLSPKNIVVVAALKDSPDVILGYSIVSLDGKKLHWVFVKAGDKKDPAASWREKGIARSLIPASIETVTHLTKFGRTLLHKIPGVIFNPFDVP